MATILNFFGRKEKPEAETPALAAMLGGFSVEVMPRTAEKIESFRELFPEGTRIYIAHIDGTPIEDMVATARRIAAEGFPVMPHFPARSIPDAVTLADWIARYQGEAGVDQALVLGGGIDRPRGEFDSSIQLLETGLFEGAGFRRLHVAGHPEGNRDIDPDGSGRVALEALRWKQAYAERTGVEMAIATQFCFEAAPVIAWAERLRGDHPARPYRRGRAGETADADQVRHGLRRRPEPSGAATARRRCYKAGDALHARGVPGRAGRPQGGASRLRCRAGALLPARRHPADGRVHKPVRPGPARSTRRHGLREETK